MCMGYAKEIKAWVCDEARGRREAMMNAWGEAFEAVEDKSGVPPGFEPCMPAFNTVGDLPSELVQPRRSSIAV